ncbi:MAG: PAS domain S-box protein [Chloroflexales bacterium]|nr:PAS domain S-box protein [Chloroflexales bacterium]
MCNDVEPVQSLDEGFSVLFDTHVSILLLIDPATGTIHKANHAAAHFYGYALSELCALPIERLCTAEPEQLALMHQRALRNEQNRFVQEHRAAGEELRTVEVAASPLVFGGQPMLFAIVHDITERRQTEELSYAQRDLARIIGATTSGAEAWPQCLAIALRLTGMDSGGIYLFDSSFRELQLVAHHGLGAEFLRATSRYPAEAPNVQLIFAGAPLFFDADDLQVQALPQSEGLQALASVPIQHQGRVVGCVNLASHTLSHVPPFSRQALETLATEIGSLAVYLRTEAALRASEELYRTLITSQESAISTLDADGVFHYINQIGAAPLTGMPATVIGKRLHDFFPPQVADQQLAQIRQVIASGQGTVLEIQHRVTGEPRWYHTSVQPIRDTDGHAVLAMINALDITVRKQAEESLRAEQLRFAKVSDTIPGAICTFLLRPDGSLCIPYASKMFEELYGLTLADVRENIDALLARVSPEQAARLFEDVGESARTLQPWRNEYRYHHPLKGEIWLEGYSMPIREADGSIVWHGFTTDITARKRAEETLRESERRFATIFHTSPVGIIITRLRDNRVEDINTAALTLFGYQREELIGRTALDVGLWAEPRDRQRLQEALRQHQEVYGFESMFCHRSGEQRFMLVSAELTELNGEPSVLFQIVDITARKQGEEQLRQSEVRFRALIEHAPGALALVSASGRFTFVSASTRCVLGYDPEDALGLEPAAITHPDDLPALLVLLDDLMRRPGSVATSHYRIRHQDGSWRWVESTISNLFLDPNVQALALNWQDITERKQAEQALLELNQTLEQRVRERTAEVQDLYENAPVGYPVLDANGTILMINQTQLDWLGYTREELLGQSVASFLTPASMAAFAEGFPVFKEQGSVRDLEFEMVRKDGTLIPVLLSATAVYDEHGEHVMSRSTVFDNSARKQAELALRESEEQNRLLFEESPDAVVLFRADGTLAQLNRAFELLTGYHAPQLLDQTLDRIGLVPQETALQLKDVVTEHIQANTSFAAIELRLRRASGEFRDVGVRVFGLPIRGQQHYLATMRDITTEKQVEETLRQANAELARAARAKDEFLANMSHELRTPLNAILGLSETLLEEVRGPLNAHQQGSVRNIEASGRHLLALITDILDLSKVEAGRLELQVEKVNVAELCQASLLFVKEQAIKKSLRLAFTLNDQMAEMEADVRRLKQMLVNLLSNAVKFTPARGAVRLGVDVDAEAGVIRFAVQDTGIGIAADDLARLFQPFKQLDSSLSRQHEGTGLGLALVRRLAELHGGSVAVESEPDQGSCFTISLPYRIPQPGSSKAHLSVSDLGSRPTPLDSALVVEDSESAAEQLTRYLQETSVRVFVHRQGEGALEQAIRLEPNVIFLDILMPDRSGWEVLAQLKSDPRTRDIPVVMVTVVDDRVRGLAAGAAEYILKPFTREVLRRTLHTVVAATEHDMQQALVIVPRQAPPPTSARLLLVEDNEANILAISDYLQARGYALSVARNGREALSQIDASRPELILMDIQMPEMDGLEATRRLRAIPAYAQVPIIALTALAMPGDRERCLQAGANEYLTKPVSLKALAERIQQLLDG